MNKIFRDQEVKKTYLAVVEGTPEPEEDDLVHWLNKDSKKNIVKVHNQPKGKSRRACLHYKVIASHGSASMLEIQLKTGRPHQIRVQMKAIGCPIRGDLKYGYPKPKQDKSIDLHAFKLEFIHPVKKEPVKVTSRPDWRDFNEFIHELDS